MIRSALVALAVLLYLPPIHASLERKKPSSVDKLLPRKAVSSLPAASASDEYRITSSTEVLLDGRPCRFDQVPNTAIILLLETTTNESKEIARIHFRTSRRSASPTTSK